MRRTIDSPRPVPSASACTSVVAWPGKALARLRRQAGPCIVDGEPTCAQRQCHGALFRVLAGVAHQIADEDAHELRPGNGPDRLFDANVEHHRLRAEQPPTTLGFAAHDGPELRAHELHLLCGAREQQKSVNALGRVGGRAGDALRDRPQGFVFFGVACQHLGRA
jgi:hypothetical protein